MKPCSTVEMDEQAILEDTGLIARRAQLEEFTRWFEQQKRSEELDYTIPVVFHIMHNYGPENISKEQILDAVRIMNEDFNLENTDTSIIVPEFKSIASDCRIHFRLAKIDPDGNCTEGITRTQTMLTYSAGNNVKDLVRWPRNKYLNIWVVEDIASGAAGYSYYPGIDSEKDGIVVRHNYVGSIGTGSINRSRTLTHETGHFLNLKHPWGNSNEPELASNCNIDDDVEDTPLTIGHTSCDLDAVTCGSLDNVQNYMEYSYCTRMFTEGQKTRMLAALNSTVSQRIQLWQASNLIATGTNLGYQADPCTPIVDFSADREFGCTGTQIQFTDFSFNSDIGFREWQFPGGDPSFSTEQNPVVVYNSPGWHTVQLKVGNQLYTDSLIKTDFFYLENSSQGVSLPFYEGFESPSFPDYDLDNNFSWFISGNATSNWSKTVTAQYNGSASAKFNNRLNDSNEEGYMISPIIRLDGNYHDVQLSFKYAYAQRNEDSDDEFSVWVSNNCGDSWQMRFIKSGYFLSTTQGAIVSNNFVPDQSQWITAERDLSFIADDAEFIELRFLAVSDKGNPLYVDDIQINGLLDVPSIDEIDKSIKVFPNPLTQNDQIQLIVPGQGNYRIALCDIEGKVLREKTFNLTKGMNALPGLKSEELRSGIYFLKISSHEGNFVRKIVIMN